MDQLVICLIVQQPVNRSVRICFDRCASHFSSEIFGSLLILFSGLHIYLLRIEGYLADGLEGFWTLSENPALFSELILVIRFDFFRIDRVANFVGSRAHLVFHVHACQRDERDKAGDLPTLKCEPRILRLFFII